MLVSAAVQKVDTARARAKPPEVLFRLNIQALFHALGVPLVTPVSQMGSSPPPGR